MCVFRRHRSGDAICGYLHHVVGYGLTRGLRPCFGLHVSLTLTSCCRVDSLSGLFVVHSAVHSHFAQVQTVVL